MDDSHEQQDVVDVIRSIASGRRVDWSDVDTAPSDASTHAMLDELRVIARIAEVHGATIADRPARDVDETGERLGCWGPLLLLEVVGEGSYGLVYRAWDSRLDREVALKLLRRIDRDVTAVADSGGRTVEEGRLLARVRHPNVVTVYGADRIDRRVGIWMEFVDGRTLEAIVRDDGPLDADEAMRVGIEVGRGLAAVHAAGLVHRDVKAQNVMRQSDGRVVLMDFGAGLLTESTALPSLVGTPLYVAPEVLAGGTATTRSDVYALGVLLFYVLSGRYPVEGRSLAEVRTAHQHRRRSSLKSVAPAVPRRLARVVERALESDPALRFASAEECADALERARAVPRRLRFAAAAAAVLMATAFIVRAVDRAAAHRRDDANVVAGISAHQVDWRFSWLFLGSPSADGRWLSYTDSKSGNLAVLDLRSGATTLLTADASFAANRYVTSSRFGRDSTRVAYSW